MRRYPEATMTRYFLVRSGRPSVSQPTGRGEGVSSCMTNSQRPFNRLLRFSRRITQTRESPMWKILRAQPSRSTGRCRKRSPLTSRRMT